MDKLRRRFVCSHGGGSYRGTGYISVLSWALILRVGAILPGRNLHSSENLSSEKVRC